MTMQRMHAPLRSAPVLTPLQPDLRQRQGLRPLHSEYETELPDLPNRATTVVWANTTDVGCGITSCAKLNRNGAFTDNAVYVVCDYWCVTLADRIH